jgi:hypothetical protein
MSDLLTLVAVAANLLISTGYILIAAWVVPKFDAAASSWGLRAAKLAGLTFFVTCALTHLESAAHAATGVPHDVTAAHSLVVHVVQAIAAPAFLICASTWMSIRIYNRAHYLGMLDREIVRRAHALAHTVRAADVDAVHREARAVAAVAEVILKAMQEDTRRG